MCEMSEIHVARWLSMQPGPANANRSLFLANIFDLRCKYINFIEAPKLETRLPLASRTLSTAVGTPSNSHP